LRLTTFVITAAMSVSAAMPSAYALVPAAPASSAPAVVSPPDQPPERAVVGTLDRVDAGGSEFIVATSTGKQNFRLEAGATIRQGSKTIKPADLAMHKGERVKVRYHESGGARRADWVVLASPQTRKGGSKVP
jgi:hypothetical protein